MKQRTSDNGINFIAMIITITNKYFKLFSIATFKMY